MNIKVQSFSTALIQLGKNLPSIEQSLGGRDPVLISPSFELDLRLPGNLKDKELISLAIFSWFIEDFSIKSYLQVVLSERRCSNFENNIIFKLILSSKESATIQLEELYSERDFFGNTLPRLKELRKFLKFKLRFPGKSKRLVQRRGYKDKGSHRPFDCWLEKSDFSFTEIQNRREANRDNELVYLSILTTGKFDKSVNRRTNNFY